MAHSSSDQEEQVSSQGIESESASESAPPAPPSKKTLTNPNSSSDESGTESDSPDPNIKPLASKPMDDKPLTKSRPKKPTSRYSPENRPIAGKRPAPEAKKKVVLAMAALAPDENREKKQLVKKQPVKNPSLWSEDDDIELLEGMIRFVDEKRKNTIVGVYGLHEFVKKSLNVDVTNRQLCTRVKSMKTKFKRTVSKGKVRSFSNPHEQKVYELSNKLWGSEINSNSVKNNTKSVISDNMTPKQNGKSVNLGNKNVNLGLESAIELEFQITEEGIMNKGLELLSGSKKVELEEKWKSLKVQELEHFLKKLEVMKVQTELVLNALKKSGAS